jgi:transcriptional regulator with XRE-family HTH domain
MVYAPKKKGMKALGAIIRDRREAIGISQEELGFLAGLHRTYIGSVERGERNITVLSLGKIAEALQIQPHELLARAGL